VYCIDNGLRNAVSFKFSEDIGKLVENLVFLELKKQEKEVYYWKNEKQEEVDFIVKNEDNLLTVINVHYTDEVKERETRALIDFQKEFKKRVKEILIITKDTEKTEKVSGIKVNFLPLWKFLLQKKH